MPPPSGTLSKKLPLASLAPVGDACSGDRRSDASADHVLEVEEDAAKMRLVLRAAARGSPPMPPPTSTTVVDVLPVERGAAVSTKRRRTVPASHG